MATEKIALFSGGKDSLAMTHYATSQYDIDKIIHIDTGIGIEKTQEYVENVIDTFGWNSIFEIVETQHSYEEKILEYGFPGPQAHIYMYSWLKERPLRTVAKRYDEKPVFLTGIRRQESDNRLNADPETEQDMWRWKAPIYKWTNNDVTDYIKRHGLPLNPVWEDIGMSGECLCGAYGSRDELKRLDKYYPDIARKIRSIESKLHEDDGCEDAKCWWGHGNTSSKELRKLTKPSCQQMLCSSCIDDEVVDQ